MSDNETSLPAGTRLEDFRPQMVCQAWDTKLGLLGYVVIDRAQHDIAIGGIRCAPNVTVDEVAALARSMTLKCAFLNLSLGGAKAGITIDAAVLDRQRREVMLAFGRAIGPLLRQRLYIAGEDMGISSQDLDLIRSGAGLPAARGSIDGAHYAALTTVETIRQAMSALNRPLTGATIAIEGFGRVGSEVAVIAESMGMRLVAVSTSDGALYTQDRLPARQLASLRRLHGDVFVSNSLVGERIDRAAVLSLPADVLVLCARPWTIAEGNASEVRAGLLVSAANAAVSPLAEDMLAGRGVFTMPDCVASGGATLASDMIAQGFTAEDVRRVIVEDFGQTVADVMAVATASGRSPAAVARSIAWANYDRLASVTWHGSMRSRLRRLAGRGWRQGAEKGAAILYSHGWLRAPITHDLALAGRRHSLCERPAPIDRPEGGAA